MVSEVKSEVIPFYLITGFLGSGKTTLLKNVLARYSGDKRIAVIQNEFAPTGVDGMDLKMTATDFKLVEINNGSVFCICLMATFVESLQKIIIEYNPEMIFLEASGLADPVNIIELLDREGLNGRVGLGRIITIVDAPNFDRGRKTLPRFRHQIMIADTVIINKTDVYEGSITLLYDHIRDMNPFAGIIETAWCKTDLKNLIFPGVGISGSADSRSGYPGVVTTDMSSSEGHDLNACVLRSHDKLTPEGLKLFIKELQESSPRIKGFVNLKNGDVMAVQTVFEHCVISKVTGYEGPSEMIAFGRDMTPRYLRDLLRKHS